MTLYCNNEAETIFDSAVEVLNIDYENNLVYFNSSATLYSANLYDGSDVTTITEAMSLDVTFKADKVGDYVIYYTAVDKYASNYAVIHKQGDEENKFIGKKINDDIYNPADELE